MVKMVLRDLAALTVVMENLAHKVNPVHQVLMVIAANLANLDLQDLLVMLAKVV